MGVEWVEVALQVEHNDGEISSVGRRTNYQMPKNHNADTGTFLQLFRDVFRASSNS